MGAKVGGFSGKRRRLGRTRAGRGGAGGAGLAATENGGRVVYRRVRTSAGKYFKDAFIADVCVLMSIRILRFTGYERGKGGAHQMWSLHRLSAGCHRGNGAEMQRSGGRNFLLPLRP